MGNQVVLGIDPSLTSSGFVVLLDTDMVERMAFQSKRSGVPRLLEIEQKAVDLINKYAPSMIAIETCFAGIRGGTAIALGELSGILRTAIYRKGNGWIDVAPAQVKKFATGKGVADKDQMLMQVYKRWSIEFRTHDEADAYVLAQIARAVLDGTDGLTQFQKEVVADILAPKAKGKKAKAG